MQTNASQWYTRAVRECALDKAGQGAFTVKEFCELCGFKDTHNLRKRLNQMVQEGILSVFPAYTKGGKMANFYALPAQQLGVEQLAFPF